MGAPQKQRFKVELLIDVDTQEYDPPHNWDWPELLDLPDRNDLVSVEVS